MGKKRVALIYIFLGYVVILAVLVAVALVIGGTAYLLVSNGVKPSQESLRKWVGLTGSTVIAFGFAIKESRSHWRSKVFWTAVIGLLFVHLACFLTLFRFIQHWVILWFFVICTFEIPLIEYLATCVASWERRRAARTVL